VSTFELCNHEFVLSPLHSSVAAPDLLFVTNLRLRDAAAFARPLELVEAKVALGVVTIRTNLQTVLHIWNTVGRVAG
jgi:hypothetical protein